MPYKDPGKQREYHRLYQSRRRREDPEFREYRDSRRLQWESSNPFMAWASKSNTRHRMRGIAVTVDVRKLAELASKSPICPHCGVALDYAPFKGQQQSNSATVDRVNNDGGVNADNIQIVCMSCNRRKGKRSPAQFLERLSATAEARA
jgi:5-methylcytosine-specific restriction endonuclease McrA